MNMEYRNPEVAEVAKRLRQKFETLEDKRTILRAPELTALYERIKELPPDKRAAFGKEVNALRAELEALVKSQESKIKSLSPIDITAPFDTNVKPTERPGLLPAKNGSKHPLMTELEQVLDIFGRMGFTAVESREIDDDYHMFSSLNFPPDHPARDDYDTFVTDEELIAPAHTSTMQNRVLKANKKNLEAGKGIRYVIPGRVFRNEDLDARHEHTFYQLEGVYVDEGINAGHLIATLKTFFTEYFQTDIKVKTQPFYFPFTEPSFEFAASCPFCGEKGCSICSYTGWIELLGCGMIHPNVLKEAGIDSNKYTGFAWGGGIERLVMIKYGIEDIRHFHSGNLRFLRQFS
ncbi:MAG TPA: phenylalanine--tRNA ligase subunit alpha [Candidatus Saccharimonadales bacterium]|nr:phenylalanine--tRNA ligase subunit alpha [Candidatus Saccharimonadales bacterium]